MFNFQEEQLSILIVTAVLGVSFYLFHRQFNQSEEKPLNRFTVSLIKYVEFIYQYTVDAMGEKYGRILSGYMGSVFIYLLLSNVSGLFGISPPTTNFSVTLAVTLISWLMIQIMSIKANGLKEYIRGFFDPFAFFVIPNIFGLFAPLISMSLRLFGNLISGGIIMGLLYQFTAFLSAKVPLVGGFNFLGVIITPFLHLYFDLFSGFLQAFIFLSLTVIFIGVEITD